MRTCSALAVFALAASSAMAQIQQPEVTDASQIPPSEIPDFTQWTEFDALPACTAATVAEGCTALTLTVQPGQVLNTQPIQQLWQAQVGQGAHITPEWSKLASMANVAQQMVALEGGTLNVVVVKATAWIHPVILVNFMMEKSGKLMFRQDLTATLF